MNTIDVGMIRITKELAGLRGGTIYEDDILEGIKNDFDTQLIEIYIRKRPIKLLRILGLGWDILKLKGSKDVWIRSFKSTIFVPYDRTRGKNISLFFHHDPSVFNFTNRKLYNILIKLYYKSLKNVDIIVTISDYWKNHFIDLGYNGYVKKIYCGFDTAQFDNLTSNEVDDFKKKYGLKNEKPIIYLGNCQESKGVVEAYKELKDFDAYLVTSGNKEIDIPAINLNLTYKEYLLLLKASSVAVTMSKFKEGWGITTHEAMLCKTPVVGSGLGGMGELLEGGKQIICGNFNKLKEKVKYAMEHQELGESGYQFASQKQFTIEHFNDEWTKLIRSMVD